EDKPAEAAGPKQITLKRRKVEELTVSAGKAKTTVNVEVRQKRTYLKRDQADAATPAPANSEHEEVLRKLEEARARQQAELDKLDAGDRKRREEEIARKEVEEAARKKREAEAAQAAADAAAAAAAAATPDEDGRPNKHAPRPHKADMPRESKGPVLRPAPGKAPAPANKASAPK